MFVCGRYEGVDERVAAFVDEEVSIGDYVLSSGDLAALVTIDAVVRLLPGVLGERGVERHESYYATGVLEGPQYTRRPRSAMHACRTCSSRAITRDRPLASRASAPHCERPPDLLETAPLDDADVAAARVDRAGRHG